MTINRDLELIVVNNGYPLVNIPKTMERSTMLFIGKSTISTGPWLQCRKLLNYQRVIFFEPWNLDLNVKNQIFMVKTRSSMVSNIKLVMVKSTFFMHTNWISTIKNGGLTMTSLFLSHNKSNFKHENLLFTIKNGYLTMTNVTFNHGKMFF